MKRPATHKDRRKLRALERRMEWLEARILAAEEAPYPALAFIEAEAAALRWAIEQVGQVVEWGTIERPTP